MKQHIGPLTPKIISVLGNYRPKNNEFWLGVTKNNLQRIVNFDIICETILGQ